MGLIRDCRRCPRLAAHLDDVRASHPDYHARPVAAFGAGKPRLLIVGLAPGMHGANATGRPFTGDHAGILLYETLFKFGFSNQAEATRRSDGLELIDCRITNAVKCLPPQNKPTAAEVNTCNDYLRQELDELPAGVVILALGRIAHDAVVRALGQRKRDMVFGHGHEHSLTHDRYLLDSYHCSRYNTQTKRLTPAMFEKVFKRAQRLIEKRRSGTGS